MASSEAVEESTLIINKQTSLYSWVEGGKSFPDDYWKIVFNEVVLQKLTLFR